MPGYMGSNSDKKAVESFSKILTKSKTKTKTKTKKSSKPKGSY
jgi:hypothetical protein